MIALPLLLGRPAEAEAACAVTAARSRPRIRKERIGAWPPVSQSAFPARGESRDSDHSDPRDLRSGQDGHPECSVARADAAVLDGLADVRATVPKRACRLAPCIRSKWGMARQRAAGPTVSAQAPGVLPGGRLPAANMRKVLARPSATSTIEMMRSLFSPASVSCLGGG
jgi:hypothetical protein